MLDQSVDFWKSVRTVIIFMRLYLSSRLEYICSSSPEGKRNASHLLIGHVTWRMRTEPSTCWRCLFHSTRHITVRSPRDVQMAALHRRNLARTPTMHHHHRHHRHHHHHHSFKDRLQSRVILGRPQYLWSSISGLYSTPLSPNGDRSPIVWNTPS